MEEKERFEPEEVQKESEIIKHLNCFNNSLGFLEEKIIQLENRLAPVMSEAEKEDKAEYRDMSDCCYVLQKLIDYLDHVNVIKGRIEYILKQLQI